MKKLLAVLLALAMLLGCTALAETAAAVDYTGWWTLTGIEMMGVTVDPTQLSMNMNIVLYEDGSCEMIMTGEETEQGVWAVIEGGVAVTDASNVTMNLMLREDGALTMEQSGMTMVFTAEAYSMPQAGLTLADFEGAWKLSYVEYMGQFLQLEDLGMEIDVTITGDKGQMVITDAEGALSNDGVCELAEEEGVGSVLYFMFTDPATGEQDGSGVMLMKFSAEELVWYTWDETGNELFYCFVPAEV